MPEDKALRECETQQMGRLQNTLKGQQADRHPFKSVFSEQLPKKKTSRHIIMPVVTLSINMITLTVYYGDNTAFAHTFTHLFLEPDSLSSLIPEAVGMGGRDGGQEWADQAHV